MIPTPSPPVYIIEFWRRTLEGREYVSSRLFSEFCKAKKYLIRNGYRPLDENVFDKNDLRAVITERSVE